jgi:prepilin-type N-terminal cleavage/methylation domain-containing protein
MSNQRRSLKKGFTLIELMVVIVIIGILAAIAIPKLFGMTAKAKASEVGPAAGTWSKLQQAFLMETGSYGSFTRIAYKGPGKPTNGTNAEETATTSFTYSSGKASTDWQTKADESATVSWTAKNIISLGDCVAGKVWTAQFSKGEDNPTAAVEEGQSGLCGQLTPNFTNLK